MPCTQKTLRVEWSADALWGNGGSDKARKRIVGRSKLPFAGYSVVRPTPGVERTLFVLKGLLGTTRLPLLLALRASVDIVMLLSFSGFTRRSLRSSEGETPGSKIPGHKPGPSMPVVIGSGSHPFPFRTRKLSLIPPMVLRGKLRGRVGRCRQ